jgi:hypothetical protein
MSELVQDRHYRRYLDTKPELPEAANTKGWNSSPPWVVYVQREANGKWGKREFWKYRKALKFLYRALELGVHDAALNCKRIGFEPPIRFARIRGKYVEGSDGKMRPATKRIWWRPVLMEGDQEHLWCMYCRRPVIFKYFSKHKRLGEVDQTVRRCTICGASERIAVMPKGRKP